MQIGIESKKTETIERKINIQLGKDNKTETIETKVSKYWTTEAIDKAKGKDGNSCRICIAVGQKGNGKSFAVKRKILEEAYKDPVNSKFAYFRLYKTDITDMAVQDYWADMCRTNTGEEPIKEITGGEWDRIKVYRGQIFFAREEKVIKRKRIGNNEYEEYEDLEIKKSDECIGRAFSVSPHGYQSIASRAYPGMKYGIFEEFVSVVSIGDDIPDIFMKEISTIFRSRDDSKIYMLGNRVSRINPFMRIWNLKGMLKQKEGTIDIYSFSEEDADGKVYTVNIAVESCPTISTGSKIIFGNQKKSIEGNQYDTKSNTPVFRDSLKKYEAIYELLLEYEGIVYILKLMIDPETGYQFVFSSPFTSYRKIDRKITNIFSIEPLTTNNFNVKIKAEVKMLELIKNGKLAFSDALTGTEVPNILKKLGAC